MVRGRAWLAGLGVPADAWFVTMHIRDGLYRGETSGGLNQFRNSRLELYDEAIRAVVARGGWVIRVGNRGRTLPEQAGVIDCTSMGEYEDWKDIFLLSQCRFVVGSNSGPVVVAQEFDVPVVGVDWFPVNPFPLSSRRSLLIHKILRNGSDGRGLSMGAASTCAYQQHPDYYRERGIQVEENSAGDIRAVVTEMMDRLDGGLTYDADDDAAQRRYEEGCRTLSPYGINFRIGREFLRENAFLTG